MARPALPLEAAPAQASRRVELLAILAFWTLMATLTAAHRVLDPRFGEWPTWLVVFRAYQSFYLWAVVTPFVFWLTRRLPFERGLEARRVLQHFVIAIVVAALVDLVDDIARSKLAPNGGRPFAPLQELLALRFLQDLTIYLAVLAAGFARDFFIRFQERQAEAIRLRAEALDLEAQLAEAQLQTLRMQLNPHFLFNTLHAVSSLVERDPKGVRRIITRLSRLLRYTLEGSSAKEVPLHQELGFLDGYLDIQQIRFQGRLEVVQRIDPEAEHAMVPNLMLQPLVENAIQHGVSRLTTPGRLEIGARREGADLYLWVRDNGDGPVEVGGDGATPGGVGLRNTRDRLAALYGPAARFQLRDADDGGTVAELWLPYHTAQDLHTAAMPLADTVDG
ncbi:MAG: histidine kinase [Bacteroidota bacterium]